MSSEQQERERLRRLRDSQIADRDPYKIKRTVHKKVTRRRSQLYRNKPASLAGMWKELPHLVHGLIFGFGAGVLVFAILPLFIQNSYTNVIAWAALVVAPLFGVLVGASLDWRDEMRDLLKK